MVDGFGKIQPCFFISHLLRNTTIRWVCEYFIPNKAVRKNIDSFRVFIEKFSLFSNQSEALIPNGIFRFKLTTKVVDIILATDMKFHFDFDAKFKIRVDSGKHSLGLHLSPHSYFHHLHVAIWLKAPS